MPDSQYHFFFSEYIFSEYIFIYKVNHVIYTFYMIEGNKTAAFLAVILNNYKECQNVYDQTETKTEIQLSFMMVTILLDGRL